MVADLRAILGNAEDELPRTPQEICGKLLWTCYMGSKNSSEDTRRRAADLAEQIGR